MSTLSERLKIAMSESGLSQADLARACEVKPPSINGWLNGKSKFLKGENLLKAAKALHVNQDWLATGKGHMTAGSRLEEDVFRALSDGGIQCEYGTPDMEYPPAFKLAPMRWYVPDIICDVDGIRVYVEVKTGNQIDPKLQELVESRFSSLVLITPENFHEAVQKVKTVAQRHKSQVSETLEHFREQYSPPGMGRKERIARTILESLETMDDEALNAFETLFKVLSKQNRDS